MIGFGENLKKARLIKGLSLRDAGKLLGMSAVAVSKYEKGEIVPNSKKLIEFANAYQVKSMDLLKVYESPKMKFTSFRKKQSLTGKKLELLKQIIEEEVVKYLEVRELSDFKSDFKLKKYNIHSLRDVEEASLKFRKDMGYSLTQPMFDLINILEKVGIVIVTIDNPDGMFDGFDGLAEIVLGIPVIVLLDDIKDGARQRFTIAHELAHLILNIANQDLDEEKVCHLFASALLMPSYAVEKEFGSFRNNINFYELEAFKQEYKVSYAATLYRLKDLNIINEYLYKKLIIQINKSIGKNDPSPIRPEVSYQFKKLVYKLEADNIISESKVNEYLGGSKYGNNRENNYNRY